jgi:integration host factor subunit beta
MTKSELTIKIAILFPQLTHSDTQLSINLMLDTITDHLADGGRAEIRGFGSFSLSTRPPRVARNPKTGEKVQVPAKKVPHFKAGVELRARVNAGLDVS